MEEVLEDYMTEILMWACYYMENCSSKSSNFLEGLGFVGRRIFLWRWTKL